MDLLDRIHPVARDLLDRVDAVLVAGGAPAGDPIWPLLRRLGALPGELVGQLAAVTPDTLARAAAPLRAQADGYATAAGSVPAPVAWQGAAADGFATTWSTLAGHLGGAPDTMAGRLVDTARYLDEVAAWVVRARRELAGALADCLGSTEAAALRTVPTDGLVPSWLAPVATPREAVRAAATLGTHLLGVVAEVVDDGQRIHDAWAGRLDELRHPGVAPVPFAIAPGDRLEIG
jgi:hypothetical protein